MNSRINTTNEDIINEISGIEYEDDDALTLLDDEEMQLVTQTTDDEDLNSFYLDYPAHDNTKSSVDLYTEELVKKEEPKAMEAQSPAQKVEVVKPEPVVPTVSSILSVPESPSNGYQNKMDQLSTNIDAYLNGSLDNRKDEVKVEKMAPVVVTSVKPEPVVQPVKPVIPSVPVAPVQPTVIPNHQVQSANVNGDKGSEVNLNQLFAQVSNNVRGATDVKRKMEDRYKELQKMYDNFEKQKKAEYDEINAYKDEVYNKLKIKKEEIEEETKKLKLEQATLANQKKQFEAEKQRIKEEAKKKELEMLDALKEREKNIEQVENGLIRRKEQLDLEKVKISKERAQCEQEKKELADNLVKFNQLIDDFNRGVDRFSESN